MKTPALLACAALSLCATMASAQAVETGYAPRHARRRGDQRGDWARAEALLTDPRLNADDPARLINLGQVYWATGRQGEALSAWRRALASPNPFEIETSAAAPLSTAELAREALATHDTALRSAAR